MTTGKLISAIVAGAATGAILGVLFAPDKGTETRKKIAKKGTDMSDAIKNGFNSMTEAITNRFDHLKGEATELAGKAKDKANMLKDDVRRQQPNIAI